MKAIRLIVYLLIVAAGIAGARGAFPDGDTVPEEKLLEDIRILSLGDCVSYSIDNSFDVKIAKLDLLISETDVMYAKAVFDTILFGEVGYTEDKRQQLSVFAADDNQTNLYSGGVQAKLPTGTELKATLSDTRSWNNSVYSSKNPAHTAQLKLEVEQPVGKNFFGYEDRNKVTLTKLAVENADLDTQDRIESHIAETEKAYWHLVFAKRSLKIYTDILEKARHLHETNVRNHDIGLIEKADLFASEANLVMRENDMILAVNRYRRAEDNLKLAMNMEEEIRLYPAGSLNRIEFSDTLADCLEEAFAKRRDYMAKKRDIEMKKIDLRVKSNNRWPEIDLKASLAMNGVEGKFTKAAKKTTVADNTEMYAGVAVSWPFENRQARSEYEKAAHEKEKAILKMKKTERGIITEVGNAYHDVNTFEKSLGNFTETVRLQSEKLKEEEKRFRHARSNTKRLIDYQHDLLHAEMSEAIAMLDLIISDIELERAKNTILDKYGEKL